VKSAFEELYGILKEEDECAPALLCVDEIEDAYMTMLEALKDVESSGLIECCCGRPNGKCEGTCTITLVREAIKKADGK